MTEPLVRLLLLIHVASTLFMVGLIWFVQIVHYPLFAKLATHEFPAYEHAHTRLTQRVVALPMLTELATGVILLWFRPLCWPMECSAIGLALLGLIWASTMFVQIPCHERLAHGFEAKTHRKLVATNWIRTVAWSLRGAIVLVGLHSLI